jgi:prevent-host-death family protein
VERVGIRQLRADAAALVRRAQSGQRTVITVRGRAAAALVGLSADEDGRSLDELVATGRLIPPRRGGSANDAVVPVWSTVRLDRLLREVRG